MKTKLFQICKRYQFSPQKDINLWELHSAWGKIEGMEETELAVSLGTTTGISNRVVITRKDSLFLDWLRLIVFHGANPLGSHR